MEKCQQMAHYAQRTQKERPNEQRSRTCAHVCICVLCVVCVMVFVLWYAALSGLVRLGSRQAGWGTLEWV